MITKRRRKTSKPAAKRNQNIFRVRTSFTPVRTIGQHASPGGRSGPSQRRYPASSIGTTFPRHCARHSARRPQHALVHFIQFLTYRFDPAQHNVAVVRQRKESTVAPALRYEGDHLVRVTISDDVHPFSL